MAAVRPAIYVATLNDYNNGILNGGWIDALQSAEQIWKSIHQICAASPTAAMTGEPAEEWTVLDFEGFVGSDPQYDRVDMFVQGIRDGPC